MARLTKKIGYRVSLWTLNGFVSLCDQEGLRPSQAVERFMELAVEKGSVEGLLNAAEIGWAERTARNEATARVLLTWLEKKKGWYSVTEDKYISVEGRLLGLLETVQDPDLRERIEEALKKS